jgi:hypothetical protein
MIKNDIGFYSVNNKQFSNKFDAVLEAQLTGAEVEWNFFDEIFSKVNWNTEPELSLDQYYKIRAEQIRNSYDYVVVFCSGGADSTNVIKTFINNGIKVDEVIGIAPMSGLRNWNYNPANVSDLNIISETKFALLPLLDELSTKHNIKVTLYDFFDDMVKYNDEEWTFNSCGNIVTALTSHFTKFDSIPHINKLAEQGKRIALVYGTDKPIIKILPDGNIFFIISDGGVNYLNMPDSRALPNVDRVLFYWSPELPDMLVKQAHVVSRLVQTPEFSLIYENDVLVTPQQVMKSKGSYQDVINYYNNKNQSVPTKEEIYKKYTNGKKEYNVLNKYTSYRSIYQRAIVPYIYSSTYTKNLWQSQKIEITEGFFTRDQDWVHVLHHDTRLSQMMLAGTKMLYDSIHPKYLNTNGTGFKNINKNYKCGSIINERSF